jgi:hypothetical protein
MIDGLHMCDSRMDLEAALLVAAAPELLQAAKESLKLIDVARRYFPKSIKNPDKFSLESTCATIGAAIAKVEGK